MSGFRRHLMATIANREYIKGFAVKVSDEYPQTFNARINGRLITFNVDSTTGFFLWKGVISSLNSAFTGANAVARLVIKTSNSIDMTGFARMCQTVTEIDCSGVVATNLYFAFGLNASDYSGGYRMSLQRIVLPVVTSSTANSNYCLNNCRQLTDVEATFIANNLYLNTCPLTLQSAINVLNALQDLQGGSKTITFGSTTSALVQADTTAMNLVAQAQSMGWTITFN